MAKRVRASAKPARKTRPSRPTAERPARALGQVGPGPAAPVPTRDESLNDMPQRSSGHLTDEELRRAAALEAETNARERAAIADALRRRTRNRGHDAVAADVNAPLSVRASHEYAYVARDVRRIALTGGLMVAILAVLHVVVNVLGLVSI